MRVKRPKKHKRSNKLVAKVQENDDVNLSGKLWRQVWEAAKRDRTE